MSDLARRAKDWTTIVPIVSLVAFAVLYPMHPGDIVLIAVVPLLAAVVFAAVQHAEVVAHRVGEPFGSLILAVAVTVIEVGLIVMLMVTGDSDTSTLARDTVFAAAMICLNGIVGLVLLVGAAKHFLAEFNPEGTGAALATVITLASITLVLPTFSTTSPGPVFTPFQLGFAAVASLALYVMFVLTQTLKHRDFFLPVKDEGSPQEHHVEDRDAWWSLALLVLALVAVVGLAKVESAGIERIVGHLGLPHAVVGVAIAVLVLAPESIAAVRAASQDQVQIGLNLGYGSAMASIGLTIPTIAVASIWLDGKLALGLDGTQIVLLAMTVVVSILTVVPGRSKTLQGGVHLILLAAFIALTLQP